MSEKTEEKTSIEEKSEPKAVDTVTQEEYNKVTKLVANLNQDNESNRAKLAAYGDITPEQLQDLKTNLQAMKEQAAEGNPEQTQQLKEEREAELRSELGKEIEKRDQELATVKAQYKQVTVISKVMNDAAKGVNDDMRSFIESKVAAFVDADSQETGAFVIRDTQGNIRYSPANPSQKMALEEFFIELQTAYPSAFAPRGVNQGSMEPGQTVPGIKTSDGATLANVDVERFKTDKQYRESLPRSVRYATYTQLKI